MMADYLSRLEGVKEEQRSSLIIETFPDEQLFIANIKLPWYADYVNYLVCPILPLDFSSQQKNKFLSEVQHYLWDDPVLFKQCANQVIHRFVPEEEIEDIMFHCYSSPTGGHFSIARTAAKILESGFYWPTLHQDYHENIKRCDRCQQVGNISRRHELPLTNVLEVEIFDVWGIDFTGPFPPSYGNSTFF